MSTNALKIFAVAPLVALKVCAVRPNELFAVPLPMVRIEFVLVNLNSLLLILAVTPVMLAALNCSTMSEILSPILLVVVTWLAGTTPDGSPISPFAVPAPINS